MADSFVRVPADSVGKRVDATSLDVGADTVYRQRVVIGDNSATAQFATVTGGALVCTGTFNISTMPVVTVSGTIDKISATALVAGQVSLAAGTSNIGFINNISATVVVGGVISLTGTATMIVGGFLDPSGNQKNVVDSANTALRVNVVAGGAGGGAVFGQVSAGASLSTTNIPVLIGGNDSAGGGIARTLLLDTSGRIILGAGTQNIGTINNISAAVVLAAGANNIGTINNISAAVVVSGAVSLAAGANVIGTINNISATVIVAGVVSLGAGTANIGSINNISATVIVAGEIANGSSLSTTNKPVLMAGNDSAGGAGGIARTLLVDTSGRIILGAGTNNIGAVSNAAGTALMGAVSLAAGTANIGFINNISATVVVAGTVSLGAGTAVIGDLNAISRTVQVAIGTPFTLQGISTTVTVVGNINISATATVIVQGPVAHSLSVTAGVQPLIMGGRAHTSASAAVANLDATYAWLDTNGRQVIVKNHPSLLPSASHGPKCVTVSTSATVALVGAPGAGLCVYVTQIACTNGSATLTRADAYAASQTASCVTQMYMAANGGGFVQNFDPPIKVLSNTALNSRVKPNVSQAIFVVHFYVGPK